MILSLKDLQKSHLKFSNPTNLIPPSKNPKPQNPKTPKPRYVCFRLSYGYIIFGVTMKNHNSASQNYALKTSLNTSNDGIKSDTDNVRINKQELGHDLGDYKSNK